MSSLGGGCNNPYQILWTTEVFIVPKMALVISASLERNGWHDELVPWSALYVSVCKRISFDDFQGQLVENLHERITKRFIFHVEFIALGNVSSTDRPCLLFINCRINRTFSTYQHLRIIVMNYRGYVQPMQRC